MLRFLSTKACTNLDFQVANESVNSIARSTPFKKAISALAVLIIQLGPDCCGGLYTDVVSWSGSSVTRTIVNIFVGLRMAPPLVDTFVVPEVPNCLYALFDYGLTVHKSKDSKRQKAFT